MTTNDSHASKEMQWRLVGGSVGEQPLIELSNKESAKKGGAPLNGRDAAPSIGSIDEWINQSIDLASLAGMWLGLAS